MPLAGLIRKQAPDLGTADCAVLAAAIEAGTRVHVEYLAGYGGRSTVTVTAPRLEGRALTGKAARSSYHLPVYLNSVRLVLPLPAPRRKKS